MKPLCPLRFSEFTSDPDKQRCVDGCAWLVSQDGYITCAVALGGERLVFEVVNKQKEVGK